MRIHFLQAKGAGSLIRPRLMIEAARAGARQYQRKRDLAGALAGTQHGSLPGSPAIILARLAEIEFDCEEMRRSRSPAYRPGRHVQVLSALLAEASQTPAVQAKASGSEALRSAI
jgi:hypothetical protein